MKRVNMRDAKTRLSHYLTQLNPGETLLICNRNKPVAELRRIADRRPKPRIGVAKGEFSVPKAFFEPLPADILKAFGGE